MSRFYHTSSLAPKIFSGTRCKSCRLPKVSFNYDLSYSAGNSTTAASSNHLQKNRQLADVHTVMYI